MTELLAGVLMAIAVGLMLFGLGAISTWSWAAKSPRIRPPIWITGVAAAAGTASTASFALQHEWLSAALTAFVWAMIVVGQLRLGPFRRSGDGKAL